MISIVSPVYRAEKILPELVRRLEAVLKVQDEPFEVVFVEDRGPDGSWRLITELAKKYPFIRGYRLSRNFGQHAALSAGIAKARGDKLIVMDCDLQDDPAFIPKLLEKRAQGFDVVYTQKTNRKHSGLKNIGASLWHAIFNWLSENDAVYTDKNIGTYSLISRKVANAYLQMDDAKRHYLLLLRWLGFNSAVLEIEHRDRLEGRSSYSLKMMIRHAVSGIASQSNRLLYVSIGIGAFFLATSLVSSIALVVLYILHGFREGWASQIVVTLLCTGVVLIMLGITGIYIGMIFEQVKRRPLYVFDESTEYPSPEVECPTSPSQ